MDLGALGDYCAIPQVSKIAKIPWIWAITYTYIYYDNQYCHEIMCTSEKQCNIYVYKFFMSGIVASFPYTLFKLRINITIVTINQSFVLVRQLYVNGIQFCRQHIMIHCELNISRCVKPFPIRLLLHAFILISTIH